MYPFPSVPTARCLAFALGTLAGALSGCSARLALSSRNTNSALHERRPATRTRAEDSILQSAAEAAPRILNPTPSATNPNWLELDEAVEGLQSSDEPLPIAAKESEFSCAALTNATDEASVSGATQPIAHLRVSHAERLWASIGPEPLASRDSGRSLLWLARAVPGDRSLSTIACAANFAVDLQPGDYFIYGATRATQSYFPPTGPSYRVSSQGDDTCPAALATRGLSDWGGDFPISTRAAGDLDGDGAPDLAVDYQYAFTNPGTRLLVARPYPTCYRVVLDQAASVKLLSSRTHGWKDVAYDYWTLHPVEFWGGRMVVTFAGQYDRELGRYTPTRFQRCADGFPADRSDTALRERLCNLHYRAAPARFADDMTQEWLSRAPSQRAKWQTGELGAELLSAIDERGQRFSVEGSDECPTAGDTRRFTVNLKLRTNADSEQTWTRELFVNWELGPHATSPRLSSISEASLCPFTDDDAPGALEFIQSWAELAGSQRANAVAASLSSVHAALHGAQARDHVESASVRGCASDPEKPTWLWSALLRSGSAKDPRYTPVYLLLGRAKGQWQVLRSSPIAPAQCRLR